MTELEQAIAETGYKYFGDYEMSDNQKKAVDKLVEAARVVAIIERLPVGSYTIDRIDNKTWWVGVCVGQNDVTGENEFETVGKGSLHDALCAALEKVGG